MERKKHSRPAADTVRTSEDAVASPSAAIAGRGWRERWQTFRRSTFAIAALGAVLLWLALPRTDLLPSGWLWPLGWIAPVPWLMLVRRSELPGRRPYRALWLVGFGFWLAALYWLTLPHWATGFGWLALCGYFAFYLPLFVGLTRVAVHRARVPLLAAAPVVWTGLELARAHVITGFTMASLGHTQYRWLDLIQVSDLVGFYGVCFVVMFGAACLAQMLPCEGRRGAVWPAAALIAGLGAVVLYGHLRRAEPAGPPTATIALIQGSIDIQFKADPKMGQLIHDHYRQLSQQAVAEGRQQGTPVDLVVWPETMFRVPLIEFDADAQSPDPEFSEREFRRILPLAAAESRREIAKLAHELGTALLLGEDTQHFTAGQPQFHNSAAFVPEGFDPAAGANPQRYDKMHLVMFGEYVPYAWAIPALQRLTPLAVSLTEGREPAAFDLQALRIAPNICYESVLPHVIRGQVARLVQVGREPDVLVNLTNDGWFWGSLELDQHLACAVFRAVECRKPFLIAANTGFSAWIDGNGQIVQRGPRRAAGTILAKVGRDGRSSLYLRTGDWFAGSCLLVCIASAIWGYIARRSLGRKSFAENR